MLKIFLKVKTFPFFLGSIFTFFSSTLLFLPFSNNFYFHFKLAPNSKIKSAFLAADVYGIYYDHRDQTNIKPLLESLEEIFQYLNPRDKVIFIQDIGTREVDDAIIDRLPNRLFNKIVRGEIKLSEGKIRELLSSYSSEGREMKKGKRKGKENSGFIRLRTEEKDFLEKLKSHIERVNQQIKPTSNIKLELRNLRPNTQSEDPTLYDEFLLYDATLEFLLAKQKEEYRIQIIDELASFEATLNYACLLEANLRASEAIFNGNFQDVFKWATMRSKFMEEFGLLRDVPFQNQVTEFLRQGYKIVFTRGSAHVGDLPQVIEGHSVVTLRIGREDINDWRIANFLPSARMIISQRRGETFQLRSHRAIFPIFEVLSDLVMTVTKRRLPFNTRMFSLSRENLIAELEREFREANNIDDFVARIQSRYFLTFRIEEGPIDTSL